MPVLTVGRQVSSRYYNLLPRGLIAPRHPGYIYFCLLALAHRKHS